MISYRTMAKMPSRSRAGDDTRITRWRTGYFAFIRSQLYDMSPDENSASDNTGIEDTLFGGQSADGASFSPYDRINSSDITAPKNFSANSPNVFSAREAG